MEGTAHGSKSGLNPEGRSASAFDSSTFLQVVCSGMVLVVAYEVSTLWGRVRVLVPEPKFTGVWCSGNIFGSNPEAQGSIPCAPAKIRKGGRAVIAPGC